MDAEQNGLRPARGLANGPVIWDRAKWYTASDESTDGETSPGHIPTMLRWLWAHGLTTPDGDFAAQGQFTGALGHEAALTSAMVTEPAAVFLDHYYGLWLSSLAEMGDAAFDDEVIDNLWADFQQHRAELDRVWDL